MAADALAPYVTRSSAAMIKSDKWDLVLNSHMIIKKL